jgi:Domain of unknown function (DUF4249)
MILRYPILLLTFVLLLNQGCKKPYAPPAITKDNKFLVIEGVLVNSPDSPSIFSLSRTIRLTDSTNSTVPEMGAQVSAESNSGEIVPFGEYSAGIYQASSVVLNTTSKYRLRILTTAGKTYLSDYVDVKQAPPIDSVYWQQNNDVNIFVSSHDPGNNTKYYRWDFKETWQYRSQLEAELGILNGQVIFLDSSNQQYNCWSTHDANTILIGSSAALTNDVINGQQLTTIIQNTERLAIRYSILVKQYALTEDGYQYYEILKKNTESLGSIFDAQPSELTGNFHSLQDPSEVVIGFFSASSVAQKRIFIDKSQVPGWNFIYNGRSCDPMPAITFISDDQFEPYYFDAGGGLVLARRSCLDCTLRGGTSFKPAFW